MAAAAVEMVGGLVAGARVSGGSRPAAARPRRAAVAARVLRTSASEKVAADLAVGTNGSLSALVSAAGGSVSLLIPALHARAA